MRTTRVAFCAALVSFSGGCLVETGAKCIDDSNCPSGQYCTAGACEPGNGGGDGGTAAVAGLVTFNGGVQKPAGNDAWVLAWDHPPAAPDGGLETAQITAPASTDGAFALASAAAGTAYYLAVQYDIDGDGDPGAPGDWLAQFLSPTTAGAPGSGSLGLDVQTSKCVVWSDYDPSGGGSNPYLRALAADIPDITNGNELSPNLLKSAVVNDPNNDPATALAPLSGTGNPSLDGKYGWTPSGAAPEAYDGTYQFVVVGTGYAHGLCEVRHHPLTEAPSKLAVPTWQSASTNTVTWKSAPGTEQDTVTFSVINQGGSPPETTTWTAAAAVSPLSVPGYACPSTSLCRFRVDSIHFDAQPRSTSIASATAGVIFNAQ